MRATLLVTFLLVMTACAGDGSAPSTTAEPPAPTTTTVAASTTTMPPTATTTIANATTTTGPDPAEPPEEAWSRAAAERHVTNYLAALAASAYEQAGWSAHNNGAVFSGQENGETPGEYLARMCARGACAGPYSVTAQGPGLVDPATAQASSAVTVTHIPSGEESVIRLGTFEGRLVIADLPPLVASAGQPGLVETLFASRPPGRVVVQRFDAFEVWEDGTPRWVTNWWSNDTFAVEGDWAAAWRPDGVRVVRVDDPTVAVDSECPRFVSRDGGVLVLEQCWSERWRLFDPATGTEADTPIPFEAHDDGEFIHFEERGGIVVRGLGDAEGNVNDLTTLSGVDLLGEDYAGLTRLSADGRHLAYVDHADPAALNHFWSPVVAVRDTATGSEIGRWTVEQPIGCLEFADTWLVVCEMGEDPLFVDAQQIALVAIDIETAEINRAPTRARLFLP